MSHMSQVSLSCVIGHQMGYMRPFGSHFQSSLSGTVGGGGGQKVIQGLRRTALLPAEGKKELNSSGTRCE
jgi:hypothetical protein